MLLLGNHFFLNFLFSFVWRAILISSFKSFSQHSALQHSQISACILIASLVVVLTVSECSLSLSLTHFQPVKQSVKQSSNE